MRRPHHNHRDAEATDRAVAALNLRRLGVTYDVIAQRCGFASRSGAYQSVQRELRRTVQEPADTLRQIEGARLDALWRTTFPQALAGDLAAVDRCLHIMASRATLYGLDAPRQGRVQVIGSISALRLPDLHVVMDAVLSTVYEALPGETPEQVEIREQIGSKLSAMGALLEQRERAQSNGHMPAVDAEDDADDADEDAEGDGR